MRKGEFTTLRLLKLYAGTNFSRFKVPLIWQVLILVIFIFYMYALLV